VFRGGRRRAKRGLFGCHGNTQEVRRNTTEANKPDNTDRMKTVTSNTPLSNPLGFINVLTLIKTIVCLYSMSHIFAYYSKYGSKSNFVTPNLHEPKENVLLKTLQLTT
jgi:hypothetical protein